MTLAPFALKDAPAFIETQFPVGRLSAEAFKERKAVQSQTLTGLGSYWKGRKPLILCRAVTLGLLLPSTGDQIADLEIFLALMAMDDAAFARRWTGSAAEFARAVPDFAELLTEETASRRGRRWRIDISERERERRLGDALATLPYSIDGRLDVVDRPEELNQSVLLSDIWPRVNAHLGTSASTLPELVEQLGIARFGHRPKLSDTFSGGGSIPFEAARIGCDVHASDLNPVACMLTWGAFNIIGASPERRAEMADSQEEVAAKVDAEITALGIEHDSAGNRAKAYLYCLETRCPKTKWMVPMLPSLVISKAKNTIARLVPDYKNQRYDINIVSGVSNNEMISAEKGTVQGGRLVHQMNTDPSGVEISTIRGDRKGGGNALRAWQKTDITPRPNDVWQERLFCVQWTTGPFLHWLGNLFDQPVNNTMFMSVSDEDLERERHVERIVVSKLEDWQSSGFIPDMIIEPGEKTDEPIRTRGWTYWHHLFAPRQLLFLGALREASVDRPESFLALARTADWSSRLCRFGTGAAREAIAQTFYNQALNPFINYGVRSFGFAQDYYTSLPQRQEIIGSYKIRCAAAREVDAPSDLFVTDPPYADAVNYHEITEFFIAWLRKNPPSPFDQWTWDSRRTYAIKGRDAGFRRQMVEAYAAMTKCMPDNGMQVVMFTHQDAGVWADLAGILWAAGLRVTAAWNIVTETESALKAGNYVQGTVCLVLRKRLTAGNARQMELEGEIETAVRAELSRLTTLSDGWTRSTGGEALYTDGDLTLAAYAAALRVVTAYATIDRRDVGADVLRDVPKNEKTPLRTLIDYAESVANRELVPQGFARAAWRDLPKESRFYVRMLDMEARGTPKVADFQNFAKSFALGDYTALMASTAANAAALAGPSTLKGRVAREPVLAAQPLFQLLFAVWKAIEKDDPKVAVTQLRTHYGADYWSQRQKLVELADYVAAKTARTRPDEAKATAEVAEALKVDRI